MKSHAQRWKKLLYQDAKYYLLLPKKQAKDIVSKYAEEVKMPYITERWPGGMLTNFITIRKAVKKMSAIDRSKQDGTFESLSKKEKLSVDRTRAKLEKNLGSINSMTRLPGAIFVVDIRREHIAVREAIKLNIPIFAMVDTNTDPRLVDLALAFLTPYANTIQLHVTQAIRVLPGEKAQMAHRDRWAWSQIQLPPELEPQVNPVLANLLSEIEP